MLFSFFERLRAILGSLTPKLDTSSEADADPARAIRTHKKTMVVDRDLLLNIDSFAKKENKTADEITNELLLYAIYERHAADTWLALWTRLSVREKQTASLICLGYTNHQIAGKMAISLNTVKTHIKNVLAHFRVNSKAELRELLNDWDFTDWVNNSLKSQND